MAKKLVKSLDGKWVDPSLEVEKALVDRAGWEDEVKTTFSIPLVCKSGIPLYENGEIASSDVLVPEAGGEEVRVEVVKGNALSAQMRENVIEAKAKGTLGEKEHWRKPAEDKESIKSARFIDAGINTRYPISDSLSGTFIVICEKERSVYVSTSKNVGSAMSAFRTALKQGRRNSEVSDDMYDHCKKHGIEAFLFMVSCASADSVKAIIDEVDKIKWAVDAGYKLYNKYVPVECLY